MKENPSFSTPCENAAVRVHYWFGKDKENLLRTSTPSAKTQEFSKKHKCDLMKTPRISSQVEHLPLQGYVLSKKKRQTKPRHITKENFSKALRFCVDHSHCSINQKNMNFLQPENALSSERVAHCRLKGHFLVSKRLKNISKQGQAGSRRHNVVPIKASSQKGQVDNPYLQEWGKVHEERHFQIDRVIKYLTD